VLYDSLPLSLPTGTASFEAEGHGAHPQIYFGSYSTKTFFCSNNYNSGRQGQSNPIGEKEGRVEAQFSEADTVIVVVVL
jgi:hypothetical protein